MLDARYIPVGFSISPNFDKLLELSGEVSAVDVDALLLLKLSMYDTQERRVVRVEAEGITGQVTITYATAEEMALATSVQSVVEEAQLRHIMLMCAEKLESNEGFGDNTEPLEVAKMLRDHAERT